MRLSVKIIKYFTYCCIISNMMLFFPSLSFVVKVAVASTKIFISLLFESNGDSNLHWKFVFLFILCVYLLNYLYLFIIYSRYLIQSVDKTTKEAQQSNNISIFKGKELLIVADLLNAVFIVFLLVLFANRKG